MIRFSRSSIGGLRTARWYPLALTVVLAVSAGEPAVAVAAAPSQAAGDGFPVPALVGGMVLAFAVGLTAAQVRRRRRDAPPPDEPVATAEPPPPEPATKPEPTAAPERTRPEPATKPEPAAPLRPAPPRPKPAASRRPAPPPPKPAAPARPRPRVVRLEPPRAVPPPPAPGKPSWVPPEPVDPSARSAREPAAAPDPELRKAPEAPVADDSAPAPEAPEARLDQAPESPVARPTPRDASWPEEAETHWTCEIVWKAGYVKSSFRAMAGAPGSSRRRPIGESPPLRWTLMTDPDPPTPEMVAGVRALVDALIADGWERTGSAGPWYAQRFLWRGSGRPGSVVVEPPMDAGEASSA